jgi:hypothetical protein
MENKMESEVDIKWYIKPLDDNRIAFTVVIEDDPTRAFTEACEKHNRVIHVFDADQALYDLTFKCPECHEEEQDAKKD